jgi:hypothetical protein
MSNHRTIAPIEINGFEPGGTPRALPIFEWVEPGTLLIDEGYQRESSERSLKLVRKIVAGWDWAKFKAPCAVLTDAGLELIDGQHTAIAAATHPDVAKIPVMIVEVPDRADRAGAFIGHNRDRVAVTALQLHVAAVAAGDVDSVAVARVAAAAGVTVLTRIPGAGRYKAGDTIAVGAISALIRGRGEDVATTVLSVLVKGGLAPLNGVHMRAADLLLNTDEYSSQITSDQLAAAIQSMELKIGSETAVFRAAHPATPTWKAMAILWFRNRRSSKAAGSVLVPSSSGRIVAGSAGCQNSDNSRGAIKTEGSSWREREDAKLDRMRPAPITENEDRPRALLPPERKGESVVAGAKKDDRPELGRWQPGNHLRRCGPCGSPFVGGRKAEHCADCAYRADEVENAAPTKAKAVSA